MSLQKSPSAFVFFLSYLNKYFSKFFLCSKYKPQNDKNASFNAS